MMNSKMLIDITQLVHWPGRLTGIPRVMNELAIRYAGISNCRLVVWNKEEQKIFEVNPGAALKERRIEYLNVSDKKSSITKSPLKSEKAYILGGKILRKLDSYNAPGIGKLKQKASTYRTSGAKEVEVNSGDKFFVLWGDQHDNNYIEKLKAFYKNGAHLIQVVYDMLPLIAPQYSGHSTDIMDNYNRHIFPICNLILAISESTKKDIISWSEQELSLKPRVEVFRLGDDFKRSNKIMPDDDNFKDSQLKGKDFILCVGTIEARKNHTLLYYVYKLAHSRSIDLPKVVIVGRRGWKTDDIFELMSTDPEVKSKFVFLLNTSDEELSWLYSNCVFTIYPSFYEGWGLPIAESLYYGIPCICSNTSSMPEIAGNLVEYFNPASTEECIESIIKLQNPLILAKAKKQAKLYKPTSWDQTFKQVDKFIEELQ